MQLALKLALSLFAVYAVVAVAAFVLQRRLMYFPDSERVSPTVYNLAGAKERILTAPDGTLLITWYAPAAPGKPTLLYFHGNAGNLASRAERIRRFVARGYGVLMLSYRGYGGSGGSPSEAANVADGGLAYEALRNDGVPASDIVVYGESLGSGVAVQVAANHEVGGLVLDAPYTSIVDVAALSYPWLPVRPFMFDRYETVNHLPDVTAPLLVLHGEEDRVIPVSMGRAVYDAALAPKEIATFPRAGHSDHHLHGSYDVLFRWIDALMAQREDEGLEDIPLQRQMRP